MSQWQEQQRYSVLVAGETFEYWVTPCGEAPTWHDDTASFSLLTHISPWNKVTESVQQAVKDDMQRRASVRVP